MATDYVDQDNIYILSAPQTKGAPLWFDWYFGQKRVVFDDFRPWWCRFDYLLRLLDRYKMLVPVKGGFVNWIPEEIIITTQKSIEDTFTGEYRTEEDLAQLKRRITKVINMTPLGWGSQNKDLSSSSTGKLNEIMRGDDDTS